MSSRIGCSKESSIQTNFVISSALPCCLHCAKSSWSKKCTRTGWQVVTGGAASSNMTVSVLGRTNIISLVGNIWWLTIDWTIDFTRTGFWFAFTNLGWMETSTLTYTCLKNFHRVDQKRVQNKRGGSAAFWHYARCRLASTRIRSSWPISYA